MNEETQRCTRCQEKKRTNLNISSKEDISIIPLSLRKHVVEGRKKNVLSEDRKRGWEIASSKHGMVMEIRIHQRCIYWHWAYTSKVYKNVSNGGRIGLPVLPLIAELLVTNALWEARRHRSSCIPTGKSTSL